ncbi:NAD(P)H-dependent oxidoreductase [Candidatus Aerophobetes bacterium]|nr:NAD(P)H-dependent oxidoreductase [Candidatus Aerophobetes bacterium]
MRIGIIVHSQTENTYHVGEKLREKLLESTPDVAVERVNMVGGNRPQGKDIQIEHPPEVDGYDVVIFGSPVHAFSLCPAMKTYLEELPSLEHKKIACYVTKRLPFAWTGGKRAIGEMKKICQAKGGIVFETGIVVWNKKRSEQIADLSEKVSTSLARSKR